MIPLFTKPLNQLSPDDVKELIREEIPEGQHVEFKETLPSSDPTGDSWLKEGMKIGKEARDGILAEVVAFANADGGNVVLGIEESDDHPKRAKTLKPLPRCHELVERLQHAARDCIEPQLPSIEIWGIETHKRPKGGVVILRIPPSGLALHRLTTTRECYIRRADRTEKMTMREIHDRILQLGQGLGRIENLLDGRRESYAKIPRPGGDGSQAIGMRVTVIPATESIYVDKPYRCASLASLVETLPAKLQSTQIELFLPGWHSLPGQALRPILRGARRSTEFGNGVIIQEIHSDGLVEFASKIEPDKAPSLVYAGWVLNMVANALLVADAFRNEAGVPGVELILDIEILSEGDISDRRIPHLGWFQGFPMERMGPIEPIPLRLQTTRVAGRDEITQTLQHVLDDLVTATGHDPKFEFSVDLPDWR